MHFVMRPLLPQRVLFLHRAQHRRRVDAAGALAARRQSVGRSASGSDSGGRDSGGLGGSRRHGIGGGVAREARAHDPVVLAQLQDSTRRAQARPNGGREHTCEIAPARRRPELARSGARWSAEQEPPGNYQWGACAEAAKQI